jgi:hypothetical protein
LGYDKRKKIVMQTIQTANQTLFLESYFEIPVTNRNWVQHQGFTPKQKLDFKLTLLYNVQKATKKEEMPELCSQKASVFFVCKNLVFLFISFFTIESSIYYTSSAACRKACIHLAASSALLDPNCVTCIYHQ